MAACRRSDVILAATRPLVQVSALLNAALPVALLDLPATPLYPHKWLLCRPDQHLARRGGWVADDITTLIGTLSGASKLAGRPAQG